MKTDGRKPIGVRISGPPRPGSDEIAGATIAAPHASGLLVQVAPAGAADAAHPPSLRAILQRLASAV
jgi:hypothetical protein